MPKRRLLFLVAVALIALNFALPYIAAQAVGQGMQKVLNSDHVTAVVEKSPALLMLGGQFDKIQLEANKVKSGKIVFESLRAELEGVRVDMRELAASRKVAVKELQTASLAAVITQAELGAYLNRSVKGVKDAAVLIHEGKVEISSVFSLGKLARVNVKLEGRVTTDGNGITLITEKVLLNNALAGNLGASMLAEIPLVEAKALPFGVAVRKIVSEQGKIMIYADNK